MELELRVADTLSLYRGKKEKWWENVIELGAKVWQITKFSKKLQIVTNQECTFWKIKYEYWIFCNLKSKGNELLLKANEKSYF